MMKMSPMQKYAMRLLIAGGRIRVPDQNFWATMTADRADEQLRRLGGMEAVLQKTVLPRRSSRDASHEVRIPLPLLFRLRKNPILKFENLYVKKQKHPR